MDDPAYSQRSEKRRGKKRVRKRWKRKIHTHTHTNTQTHEATKIPSAGRKNHHTSSGHGTKHIVS